MPDPEPTSPALAAEAATSRDAAASGAGQQSWTSRTRSSPTKAATRPAGCVTYPMTSCTTSSTISSSCPSSTLR
jgi:hypothetical protein